ncbi:globin domain-containing protein [Chachezhania sediminis]|uniref:globin domain-containing protein n=1 Tax=Chachezhania sediminis TaxID=2599291 RepID=UPI00131C63D7|nr:globin domain-containing protein [Chachezhania sediminis]
MTDEVLVRESWAMAVVDRDLLGQRFYAALFRAQPELRAIFSSDLAAQSRKLVQMLNFIVDVLDDPEQLIPPTRDLAIRHVAYGVLPDHYDAVGTALLETLSSVLGEGFTAEMNAAWARIYTALSDDMIRTAYGPSALDSEPVAVETGR